MDMSIAAMSVDMNMARVQEELGIAVLKTAMNMTEDIALSDEVLQSVDPNLGNNIDISV